MDLNDGGVELEPGGENAQAASEKISPLHGPGFDPTEALKSEDSRVSLSSIGVGGAVLAGESA
jgi:hypothetical protein